MHVITKVNYIVSKIYSIKGKDDYYNLLNMAGHYKVEKPSDPATWDILAELICAESITISGAEYELQDGFVFIT